MGKAKIDVEKLKQLANDENVTIAEAARMLNVSYSAVASRVNRLQLEWRKKERFTIDDVVELYHNQHMSLRQVANNLATTTSAVAYLMQKHNVPRRRRWKGVENGTTTSHIQRHIYLTPDVDEQLRNIAERTNKSISSVIRCCITKGLTVIQKHVDNN